MNRIVCWSILAAVAASTGGARADSIAAGERAWDRAKIHQMQDGRLRFTDQNETQQAVLLSTVTRLQVDGHEALNRAENLRAQARLEEASKAYESALRSESRSDLAGVIRWRLMDLYGRDGQLDRAVEMFLDLARQPDFLMVVKDWRPVSVAEVRPKIREAAVAMLDEALRQTRMGLASEYIRQVREYVAGGGTAAATAAATTTATKKAGSSGPATGEAEPAEADDGTWRGQVLAMLKHGQYPKALAAADKALAGESLPRDQLEDALYVRGVALWHLAKDRDRQLQAGWALARLVIEFPASEYVPTCQYYLALVHAGLGKVDTAKELLTAAQRNPSATADLKEKAKRAYLDIANRS